MVVVSVVFSGKFCVWVLQWKFKGFLFSWWLSSLQSFLTYATIFGTDHILEHGRYGLISRNMWYYLILWQIYEISLRLQQLLHLVSLNQVQFQSRWRVSRYVIDEFRVSSGYGFSYLRMET